MKTNISISSFWAHKQLISWHPLCSEKYFGEQNVLQVYNISAVYLSLVTFFGVLFNGYILYLFYKNQKVNIQLSNQVIQFMVYHQVSNAWYTTRDPMHGIQSVTVSNAWFPTRYLPYPMHGIQPSIWHVQLGMVHIQPGTVSNRVQYLTGCSIQPGTVSNWVWLGI